MGPDGPKWGQEDFFPTDPDLADILGDTDFDFENFHFFLFFGVPNSWLGPSLGPPTWARLGPTHLGPAWTHPFGFPDAGAGGAGRILKSRSRPLPTHPGMKYFRKETLAVDFFACVAFKFGIFYTHLGVSMELRNDPETFSFILF